MERNLEHNTVLFTGGGTGGHLFPALSVAEEFVRACRAKVVFVGTPRGIESREVPRAGYPLHLLPVVRLKRVSWAERVRALLALPVSLFLALWLILRHRPIVVIGFGGYASFAVGAVAALLGRTLVLMEQNSIPGLANRLLARLAKRIFVSFAEAAAWFPQPERVLWSGNPLRRSFIQDVARGTAERDETHYTITIFGGSQGSALLNRVVPSALGQLASVQRETLRVIHQTGETDFTAVTKVYEEVGLTAETRAFFDDLGYHLGRSNLVIARAGSSVFELSYCGLPAIVIPFAGAADDHQRHNARAFERTGAALVVDEADCTPDFLRRTVAEMIEHREEWSRRAVEASALGREDSAQFIVQACLQLVAQEAAQP